MTKIEIFLDDEGHITVNLDGMPNDIMDAYVKAEKEICNSISAESIYSPAQINSVVDMKRKLFERREMYEVR